MKAESLIETACEYAGIKALGSPLDGETLSVGLSRLNSLLNSWQADNLFIPYVQEIVQTVTGNPITIGTGQTINVARPRFIRDTSFVRTNNNDQQIEVVDQQRYNLICNKLATSIQPWAGYYDNQFPVGHIYLYPAPVGSELHLQVDATLPQFADYTTDYPVDYGYQLALELSLAEKMCIGIKQVSPDLTRDAKNARATIRTNNAVIPVLKLPNLFRRNTYFNRYQ